MSYGFDATSYLREGTEVRARTLRLTVALSLLVHLGALFWLPRIQPSASGRMASAATAERLQVELAALARPAPAVEPRDTVAPSEAPVRRPRAVPRARPPPVLTAPMLAAPEVAPPPVRLPEPPALRTPAPTPPVATPRATAAPASRPREGDLSSYIQARRRERTERQGPPAASQVSIPNGQLAANLPLPATGVAARERQGGGGLFEIRRMSYDDAAFEFFGWNDDMGRQTPQLVEVRLGNNSDMRIAVVRKMIDIIREHTKADFVWRSAHRGNGVTLSARPSDNVALEEFLLRDLFDEPRQAAGSSEPGAAR